MNPRFSIVVPVYRVEHYLRQCVDSILDQGFTNFEVFLVDDGSPDSSGDICDEYAAADCRVTAIHQVNRGVASARNAALAVASGEYVVFVDGDDRLLGPDVLQAVDEALVAHSPDVLVVNHVKYWDGDPVPTPRKPRIDTAHDLEWMMQNEAYINPAWDKVVSRRLLIDRSMSFPEDKRTSEDAVWASQLLLATGNIVHVCIDFYAYLQRAGSLTASLAPEDVADLQTIFADAAQTLAGIESKALRELYGAYFARFFSFLLAMTAQHPTPNNLHFLEQHRALLKFARGRRAGLTRAGVAVLGVRRAVGVAAAARRFHHRRRSREGGVE